MITVGTAKAYNVQEAAEKLNVSAATIRAYIKDGKLKAQKAGRAFIITEDVLQAYVEGDYKENDSTANQG